MHIQFANTGRYNLTGNYNPYSDAPLAPHVIWTKPVAFGGLTGGEFGGTDTSNFYSTSQYEPKWAPIIMNGVMYYALTTQASINNPNRLDCSRPDATLDKHFGPR